MSDKSETSYSSESPDNLDIPIPASRNPHLLDLLAQTLRCHHRLRRCALEMEESTEQFQKLTSLLPEIALLEQALCSYLQTHPMRESADD